MKIISHFLPVISILVAFSSFAQITISDSKELRTAETKQIIGFDSLINLEHYNNPEEYKKYIGQQLYLIPLTEVKIDIDRKNDVNYSNNTFLYSKNPTLLEIDNSNDYLILKEKYNSDFSSSQQFIEFSSIFTNIYKPFHYISSSPYNSTKSNYSNEVGVTNSHLIGNQYYTLIDILYGDDLKKTINDWKTLFKNKQSEIETLKARKKTWNESEKTWVQRNKDFSYTSVSFILINNKSGDTVYTMNQNPIENFVLVPYFVKQKHLYEKRNLIFKGNRNGNYNQLKDLTSNKLVSIDVESKWICEEVTLLKPTYEMVYILKNQNNISLTTNSITAFVYEEEFFKRKLESQALEAKLEAQKKFEAEEEAVNEKIKQEEYKLECIQKYGEKYGNLIFNHKVDIGMTKEMCRAAYGYPIKTYQSKTDLGTFDIWQYDAILTNVYLHFLNDKLEKIEKI